MNDTAVNFARVGIPSPLMEELVYVIPEGLRQTVSIGSRVLIPLGKRKVTGLVMELLTTTSVRQTKEIVAVLDERPVLDGEIIRLVHWISQYYMAAIGEVLTAVLPSSLRVESEEMVRLKTRTFAATDPTEQKILAVLCQRSGTAAVKYLARHIGGSNINVALSRLETAGAIVRRERLAGERKRRTKNNAVIFAPTIHKAAARFNLTEEQNEALAIIESRIDAGGFQTFLLHGVTGSGKTEVYLQAMKKVTALGRRSLILIPEISLTTQLIDRLNERFPGRVGILHSGLTGAQRWRQWWNIVRGEVDVVVGARSAVFAPLPNLGLIVVDEEHDSSYKQEEGLRYNGRDVAVVRGKFSNCVVILGSATPAIESYENSRQGRYRLLEISKRVHERPLPTIEAIDLRDQLVPSKAERNSAGQATQGGERPLELGMISRRLADALLANFQNRRQSLIFLNRRGFSNFLQCRLCGHVLRCSYCSVTLTLHLREKRMRCHHCDFHKAVPDACPGCGQLGLGGIGAGTEQIEERLARLLPQARVARMDRDTVTKRGSQETLIRRWEKGEVDVLVGTQMITKGHDVSAVTLVGALVADLSLNLPDFRAAERTFQLLSQLAGRSGRGDDPGLVIVQTYAPDHYAMKHLIEHDYKTFFAAELEFRRALNYPPFSHLVQLRLDGAKSEEVEDRINQMAAALRRKLGAESGGDIEILGPAPAPIEKLRSRYRWQLLLKSKSRSTLLRFAQEARAVVPRSRNLRLHVDVDPYSML